MLRFSCIHDTPSTSATEPGEALLGRSSRPFPVMVSVSLSLDDCLVYPALGLYRVGEAAHLVGGTGPYTAVESVLDASQEGCASRVMPVAK